MRPFLKRGSRSGPSIADMHRSTDGFEPHGLGAWNRDWGGCRPRPLHFDETPRSDVGNAVGEGLIGIRKGAVRSPGECKVHPDGGERVCTEVACDKVTRHAGTGG